MFVIGAKLRLATLLYACAAGGSFLVLVRGGCRWAVLRFGGAGCFDFGAFSCTPERSAFLIAAKLRLAALLNACAAGGSFLVLARKEPKKPLLGLGVCVAASTRVRASGFGQNWRLTGFSPMCGR
ncbi:MAG: hypothetical protein LBO63_07170 [Oscillospiraceae bacterium]|nr:hypothetical protein [Oscillospiraceae bacterium]